MKLTPWFPPEVKPVHEGVYETRLLIGGAYVISVGFCHWTPPRNGKPGRWGNQWAYITSARPDGSGVQDKSWRGLTRPAA
jgi:hypothetical protein